MVINQYYFILQIQKKYLSLLKSFLFSPSHYCYQNYQKEWLVLLLADVVARRLRFAISSVGFGLFSYSEIGCAGRYILCGGWASIAVLLQRAANRQSRAPQCPFYVFPQLSS